MAKTPKPDAADGKNAGKAAGGRRTGSHLLEKYGPDYFREMGRKGGQRTAEKHGPEHFAKLGERGGATVKHRYGTNYYSGIAKAGHAARQRETPAPIDKEGSNP